jgi:hypothetical protein
VLLKLESRGMMMMMDGLGIVQAQDRGRGSRYHHAAAAADGTERVAWDRTGNSSSSSSSRGQRQKRGQTARVVVVAASIALRTEQGIHTVIDNTWHHHRRSSRDRGSRWGGRKRHGRVRAVVRDSSYSSGDSSSSRGSGSSGCSSGTEGAQQLGHRRRSRG